MLSSLLRFEWRYHTRQASFAAASLLFLFMGFVLTATGFGPDNIRFSAPWLVMQTMGILSLLTFFAAAVFVANSVLRDVDHGMLEIVYTTPVGRFHYLFGRFAGAALATMTVASLCVVGLIGARFLPGIDAERLVSFSITPYLWSLAVVMLPNVLFATALLFGIAALTRSAVATYVGAVAGYLLYFAVAALTNSPIMAQSKPGVGGGTVVALLDPFSLSSFFEVTRYWSIAEKNDRFVGLTGSLLANRLLWLAITAAIFAIVYATFSFRVLRRGRRERVSARRAALERSSESLPARPAPRSTPRIAPRWFWSFLSAARLEWRALVWNVPFLLILLLWMALATSELYSDLFTSEFGTRRYATTGLIIGQLRQPLALFGTILLVYLAAEVLWREQRDKMAAILDATPLPGSAMIAAKWTALAGLIGLVISSGIVLGMALQLSHGYTNFEPFLYLSQFYFVGLPLLVLAAATTLIHVFSPGKYAGMILSLLVVMYQRMAGDMGLDHPLLQFGGGPSVIHMDMDGFGLEAEPFGWLMLHWLVVSGILLTIAAIAWRGLGHSVRERAGLVLHRATSRQKRLVAACLTLSLFSGGWIFYNTNVLNESTSQKELDDWKAAYEKKYRSLVQMPQPSVTHIDIALDFFPERHAYRIAATQRLANQTEMPIRVIWVAVRREASGVKIAIEGARQARSDAHFGMSEFVLDRPLAPGAHTKIRYEYEFARRGFQDGGQTDPVYSNGTFLLGHRIFPTFGYRKSYELTDARERAKRGLPARDFTPEELDAFEASKEPRVNLAATLSTSSDQIALGVGRLERTWNRDGRRYFRYRAETPIATTASFGSGRYNVSKRRAGNVDVELYWHPGHPQNVDRMLEAAVSSIRTFEQSFGPYRLGVLRMVEVPRQRFAGYASPGIIWFVEDRTPLTDARDPNRADMVTRRVVHEVAHQWWGHQLSPRDGPGSSMLVETFAKHSESMMIQRLRGQQHLDQFLEMELDRYLVGRSRETKVEPPLLRTDGEPYVFYAKGAVVMNAITREIGEDAVNQAIRGVLHQPFATSTDFLEHLRTVAPPSSKPLVEEWLRDIVFYDLAVDSSIARKRPDGKYDVALRIRAGKSHADERGEEHVVPMHEPVEIVVYGADESPLHASKLMLQAGTQDVTITVDRLPDWVGLDPHVTRIDKKRNDNVRGIELH